MRSLYLVALCFAAALVASCSRDAILDNDGNYNAEVINPKPSSRSIPMTWNAWFPLESTDSVIPGSFRRADSSAYGCSDSSAWWPYVFYTPIYQSRESFSKNIGSLDTIVPLLNPGKLMVYNNSTPVKASTYSHITSCDPV